MLGHEVKRAASAAVLLLALTQGATAKCNAKTVTCVDNKHNGTIYEAPGGSKFKILCGIEYAAENLGAYEASSFVECINLCESTPGCIDASYIDSMGSCYLKGGVLHSPIPVSRVWTAEKIVIGSSSPSSIAPPSSTSSLANAESTGNSLPTSSTESVEPSETLLSTTSSESSEPSDTSESLPTITSSETSEPSDTSVPTTSSESSESSDTSVPTTSSESSEISGTSTSTAAAETSTTPPIPSGPKLNCTDGVPSQETFITPEGREYQVLCGIDFGGGDIGEVLVSDFEACLDACDAAGDRGCVTVAFNGNNDRGGLCYFKERFRNRVERGHIWGALYLGPAPTGATTSSSVEPAVTTSTFSEPEPTTTEAIYTSQPDSPPLASSKVFPPEFDDSWMSTYTYMEVNMPVYTATGTNDPVPVSTPTGCAIGPEQLGAEFHLLDFESGYVLKKGDEGQDRPAGPGFLTPPETEQEGRRLQAELADWQPPVYGLERPEGVTDGPYDLVYVDNGRKLYFSVSGSGQISFADASSESTTVFTVSCQGKFVITKDGVKYDVLATESGRLEVRQQGPDGPSEKTIVFLLKSAVPENPNSLSAAKRMAKRSFNGKYQLGFAPRCPAMPLNVWARLKPGARGNNPNGCGSKENKVPDLNFRHCCNDHDNCFDDCNETFETCNGKFLGCMVKACVNDFNRWYNFWLQPGCIATAGFYATVVQSPIGVGPFYDANGARCECYCNGQADTHLCGKQCINVRSNPSNCGGCGRTCPEGTHCSGLGCVCSKNTCGNLCLDFRTHPRNCGRCGNVCSTGYCYQGVCSELPANPTTCLPREAFENGDFQRGDGSGWSVIPGTLSSSNINLGVFDGASSDSYGMVASVPLGRDHDFQFRQRVHMCPGQLYDLTFKARRVYGDGTCNMQVRLGDRVLQNWYNLPTTGARWQDFGPYRLDRISLGQATVQQGTRHYLTKEFNVHISCTGGRSVVSTIRMDSFSIAPV
ncbi:hypothetical protein QBC44DRAFT_35421 [Cladorrhinum sp. PSN332]|nr:hypothetical protein QBC44DRAFT_35421 [Cladorrhinum sp. PSN332]